MDRILLTPVLSILISRWADAIASLTAAIIFPLILAESCIPSMVAPPAMATKKEGLTFLDYNSLSACGIAVLAYIIGF